MLEQSFWQFFGFVLVVGSLYLIFAIGVGNIIYTGNPSDEE